MKTFVHALCNRCVPLLALPRNCDGIIVSLFLSLCLSLLLSLSLSLFLFFYLSVSLFFYLSVSLFFYLSVSLSLSLSLARSLSLSRMRKRDGMKFSMKMSVKSEVMPIVKIKREVRSDWNG